VLANQGFFSHSPFVKRGLKDQYCGNEALYFHNGALKPTSALTSKPPLLPKKPVVLA
jgi:hypothetical protein